MTLEDAHATYVLAMGGSTTWVGKNCIDASLGWAKNELNVLRVLGESQEPPINAIVMFSKLQSYEQSLEQIPCQPQKAE